MVTRPELLGWLRRHEPTRVDRHGWPSWFGPENAPCWLSPCQNLPPLPLLPGIHFHQTPDRVEKFHSHESDPDLPFSNGTWSSSCSRFTSRSFPCSVERSETPVTHRTAEPRTLPPRVAIGIVITLYESIRLIPSQIPHTPSPSLPALVCHIHFAQAAAWWQRWRWSWRPCPCRRPRRRSCGGRAGWTGGVWGS